MVAVLAKIFLFLLPVWQADEWVAFRHSLMQEVRHHHPQIVQIHEAEKARLQVHRRQE